MAADAWVVHDKAMEYMGNKVIDYDTDTFNCILCSSASNISTTSIDAYSTVTNELATANGYTQGGSLLANPDWSEAGGVSTFDTDDVVWTAAGGSIVARYAGVYDDSVSSPVIKPVVCHSLLDNTPGDVTATDGNTFKLTIPAIFTQQRG